MFTRLFRKKIYLLENSLVVFILISLLLPVIHSIPLSARQSESAKHPGARWGHALVYDPVRNEIVLFGGSRERGVYLDDTWTWDGKSWHHRNVVGPRSRGFAAVAFHEAKDTVIIHGGRGSGRSTYSDTWEWDGESWQNIEKEGPYRSDHHQMVYVADDNQLLAFGGWNGHDVAGETWLWDGEWKKTEVKDLTKEQPSRWPMILIEQARYFSEGYGSMANMQMYGNGMMARGIAEADPMTIHPSITMQ